MNTSNSSAHSGFSYSREFFEHLVDSALQHAKKLGATDAGAEASEGCGLSVSVRKGELENVERNRDKSLGVTVYVGHRRGNASTSDFSQAAIERTVQAAYDIARFTAEDSVAGLPDERDIETEPRELDLFHPWAVTSEQAAELALKCEAAALKTSKRITNFEGKRRQMQFIGKLMRLLDEDTLQAVRHALELQRLGHSYDTEQLHLAEQWRDRLIASDEAVQEWIAQYPGTDTQQLRALVRQARKDAVPADKAAVSQGLAPRQGRAFREIFQLVKATLKGSGSTGDDTPADEDHDD